MEIRELRSDADIAQAYALMARLRDRIRPETFLAEVRRQEAEGYRLAGGFYAGSLVALAGYRRTHTLSRGEHLFVDDLVVSDEAQGRGHGRAVMGWLAELARSFGIGHIYLDSRDTARGFYEALGFTFLTSIPSWIEVERLLSRPKPGRGDAGVSSG